MSADFPNEQTNLGYQLAHLVGTKRTLLSLKQSLLIQKKCAMPKCNKYCATLKWDTDR